jgi:hypothetical protein
MTFPHPLDRLIEQDTFREILSLLTPQELIVAVLRLEGLSDGQIGALLGITASGVSRRIERARARIIAQRPELGPVLRDRRQPHYKPPSRETLPLEYGWLCRQIEALSNPGTDLTTHDVARRYQVTPQTVTRWIRAGCFPHAYRLGDRQKTYRIPEADLAGFRPKQGR